MNSPYPVDPVNPVRISPQPFKVARNQAVIAQRKDVVQSNHVLTIA